MWIGRFIKVVPQTCKMRKKDQLENSCDPEDDCQLLKMVLPSAGQENNQPWPISSPAEQAQTRMKESFWSSLEPCAAP